MKDVLREAQETNTMKIQVPTTEDMIAWGKVIGAAAQPGDCVALCGDLGAGKTHFTKGIALGLGMHEEIASPTFNIVYEYETGRIPLYHFDLYRLERQDELDDIAYWELLEGEGVSVLEWGDKFPEAMPADYLKITFEILEEDARELEVEAFGPRGEALASALASQGDSRS